MTNKVFQLLSILHPSELKPFERWLRSPWCNSQQKLHELFVLLRPHHPHFDPPKARKETLFQQLYPEQPELGEQLLLQCFRERHQANWFRKGSLQLIERLRSRPTADPESLHWLSTCYEQLHRHPELSQKQRADSQALDQAQAQLDRAYALRQYRFLSERHERHKILGDQDQLPEQLRALDQWTRQHYLDHLDALHPTDHSIFLFLLLTDAARLRLRGEPHIHRDIFALFQLGLDRQLLLHHDRMSEVTFTNILTMAQLSQAHDFAHDFIETYAPKLAPQLRDDAHNWGRAFVAFHSRRANPHELELTLHQRGNDLTTFSVRSRILLLQMYFEELRDPGARDANFLLARCEAFAKLVRRKRSFPEKNRTAILRTLRYLRKLVSLTGPLRVDQKEVAKVRVALEEEPRLHARDWLLERLKELGQPK